MEVEDKIKQMRPFPLKVLKSIIKQGVATSNATISQFKDSKQAVWGAISYLKRNELVEPFGKDEEGKWQWQVKPEVKDQKENILDLIDRITGRKR